MNNFPVKYRLEIDYYSRYYENKCCESSLPVYELEKGLQLYEEATKEHCIDKPNTPVRVHLWEYAWDTSGKLAPVTICKNY